MVYELLTAVTKGLQAKTEFINHTMFVCLLKVTVCLGMEMSSKYLFELLLVLVRMYSYSYSSITNVLVLLLIHHQCTRSPTHTSPMYSFSYSSITNVLVLIHHQCTRSHPSPMYSFSSITNVLVFIHHQFTRTCTCTHKKCTRPQVWFGARSLLAYI